MKIRKVVVSFTLCVVATIAASSLARAQNTVGVVGTTNSTTAEQEILATAALQHLRDDQLAQALDVIGKATDRVVKQTTPCDALAVAAASLNRALAQLSLDEQYELLHKWTMPDGDRDGLRVLASLVPQVAPPEGFARALGERPKTTSFPIASIGDVDGLFCSSWNLVVAADAAGSLRQLTAELEKHAANEVPNAQFVLALAKIKDSRSNAASLGENVLDSAAGAEGKITISTDYADAVLVAAALQRKDLGELSELAVDRLNQFDFSKGDHKFVPFLRRLRAMVILQNRAPETPAADLFYSPPKMWLSANTRFGNAEATGADRAIWLTHEDHLKKLAGPGDDLLLFRYPVTGNFELKGELANLDHGGGGMTYGGLTFDAKQDVFRLKEVGRSHSTTRIWPFVPSQSHRMFNRVNVRSDGTQAIFLSNLHPGWYGKMKDCESCPWLGLRAFGYGRAVFRNLELVGDPVIPREVRLSDSDDLRGWSGTYQESLPAIIKPKMEVAATETSDPQPTVWQIADGIITSQPASTDTDEMMTSLLSYMRPLLEDETITYEYFYEPARTAVHPAIGRLAFLMEPKGIRVRWLTNSTREWTGLAANNALLEPLNRRGPSTLPLTPGWNTVQVARARSKVSVSLNGTEIYLRPIDEANSGSQYFGFHLDRNKLTARIRNVVLTGKWPEKPDAADLNNLVSVEGSK